MNDILKEILAEINKAKKESIGTYRGGDYRIGLTKASDIIYNISICQCTEPTAINNSTNSCICCGKYKLTI